MYRVAIIVAVAVCSMMFSHAALAEAQSSHYGDHQGWYIGVGVNRDATQQWSGSETVNGATYTFDYQQPEDQDLGYTLLVGKQLNPWFSVELTWMKVGDLTITDNSRQLTTTMDHASATTLTGLIRYPVLGSLDIFAKGGLAYYRADYSDGTLSQQDAYMAFAYGAGLQLNLNHFSIRMDYTRIDPNSGTTADPVEKGYIPDLLGLNVVYSPG